MKLLTKLYLSFIIAVSMVWEFIGENIPEIMFAILVAGLVVLSITAKRTTPRRASW
jgi:hypothetical protein